MGYLILISSNLIRYPVRSRRPTRGARTVSPRNKRQDDVVMQLCSEVFCSTSILKSYLLCYPESGAKSSEFLCITETREIQTNDKT